MRTSHVTGTASEAPTPAQMKEFYAQVEKGLIDKNRFQEFLRRESASKKRLSGFALARDILGDDFLGPKEIIAALGLIYYQSSIGSLRDSMPPKETLQFLRQESFLLLAGPPKSLSAREVYLQNCVLFEEHETVPILKEVEKLYHQPQAGPGWLAICKVPKNHEVRTLGDCLELSCTGSNGVVSRSIPDLAQAMWGFSIHGRLRGFHCIPSGIVFTTSTMLESFDPEGGAIFKSRTGITKDESGKHLHLIGRFVSPCFGETTLSSTFVF